MWAWVVQHLLPIQPYGGWAEHFGHLSITKVRRRLDGLWNCHVNTSGTNTLSNCGLIFGNNDSWIELHGMKVIKTPNLVHYCHTIIIRRVDTSSASIMMLDQFIAIQMLDCMVSMVSASSTHRHEVSGPGLYSTCCPYSHMVVGLSILDICRLPKFGGD